MSNTVPITVTIPVGPHPANQRWLAECLQSVREQTKQPEEILIIDDGAHLDASKFEQMYGASIYSTIWSSGVAHAFNCGVALSKTPLVFMLGSDDRLLPRCMERMWAMWQHYQDPHGYYGVTIQYSDGRPDQTEYCNAAMVHQSLWYLNGGFPIESSVGMPDCVLIGMMMAADGRLGHLYREGGDPLYWYRVHEESDTNVRRARWHPLAESVRNLKTDEARHGNR